MTSKKVYTCVEFRDVVTRDVKQFTGIMFFQFDL